MSNLKLLIEKLEDKNKRYNRFISKVNYFNNKIENLKKDNQTLKENRIALRNEGIYYNHTISYLI